MRIYVGNLSYDTVAESLEGLFGQHGTVEEVHLPTDRSTGRLRGFAFITMPNDAEAQAAVGALNGAELDGRVLTVSEARPRPERGGGYGGGGGGGGRRGGGGGGRRGGGGGGGGRRW